MSFYKNDFACVGIKDLINARDNIEFLINKCNINEELEEIFLKLYIDFDLEIKRRLGGN